MPATAIRRPRGSGHGSDGGNAVRAVLGARCSERRKPDAWESGCSWVLVTTRWLQRSSERHHGHVACGASAVRVVWPGGFCGAQRPDTAGSPEVVKLVLRPRGEWRFVAVARSAGPTRHSRAGQRRSGPEVARCPTRARGGRTWPGGWFTPALASLVRGSGRHRDLEISGRRHQATENVRASGEWSGSLSQRTQRVGGRNASSTPRRSRDAKLSRQKTAISRTGPGRREATGQSAKPA
jgi:hypothetical protein